MPRQDAKSRNQFSLLFTLLECIVPAYISDRNSIDYPANGACWYDLYCNNEASCAFVECGGSPQ